MEYNGYKICIISKDNTLRLQGNCMLVEVCFNHVPRDLG